MEMKNFIKPHLNLLLVQMANLMKFLNVTLSDIKFKPKIQSTTYDNENGFVKMSNKMRFRTKFHTMIEILHIMTSLEVVINKLRIGHTHTTGNIARSSVHNVKRVTI